MAELKNLFNKSKTSKESYSVKTADEILKELDEGDKKAKLRTKKDIQAAKEELEKQERMKLANQRGRKQSTTIDIIKRQIRSNPDLRVLICVVVLFSVFGYFFARIYLGWTTTQIKTEIMDFVYLFGTLLAGSYTGYLKLKTKTGSIGRYLQTEQDRKRREEEKKKFDDLTQRTIIE